MQNASLDKTALTQTSLRTLNDADLLHSTRVLVQRERELTTAVLQRLMEIERRKLYCDIARPDGLKYGSLFEYAVRELKYSEAAAARRIQAMRLLKEMPEVEGKIESGALTLSNIAAAQTFLREVKRAEPARVVSREEKVALLEKLEEKSTREGERILLSMTPVGVLPKERERQITPDHSELRLVIDQEFKDLMNEARSLVGPESVHLSLVELMKRVTRLGVEKMKENKFGKRRVQAEAANSGAGVSSIGLSRRSHEAKADAGVENSTLTTRTASTPSSSQNPRYIPRSVKHAVWQAAHGKCIACGSRHNLQFDHVQPVALGGTSTPENLQLLCGACNLRRGVKTFGTQAVRRV